ncbi:uncharacterized protein LOC133730531 [Rosa rugosa]|uniref:uncharacterized protein LOC133730531 n=1 Tax=Rosa rugosa TaxID=74645 RepID=UPI002B40C828|nr:uncharacterized protein LOC133730531 [Rosa rugosa]
MAGDFNEILSNSDKSSGVPRAAAPMLRFRQMMTHSGLFDMGYVGSQFTWSNRHTKERLDRGFQTLQWRTCFPYSRVLTLPPSESDHSSLLVEVQKEYGSRGKPPRRFRFEEMWHGNAQCQSIIQQGWATQLTGNALQQLGEKIKVTGEQLMQWHKVEFEKQKVEMRTVQEQLNAIMSAPYSPEQYVEQRLVHVKYSQLLAQQETYWRQRARTLWLKDGDRNSAYFHRKASNRRSHNLIKGLMNEHGVWQVDPNHVKDILLKYYNNIFTTEGTAE